MSDSKTPRTDDELASLEGLNLPTAMGFVHSDFARTLELELRAIVQASKDMHAAQKREIQSLQQQVGLEKTKCEDYRSYLYGCDTHKLWKVYGCMSCIEHERDTLKQQLATVREDTIRECMEVLRDEKDTSDCSSCNQFLEGAKKAIESLLTKKEACFS